MSSELCEDMSDVVLDGSRADVELVGDGSCGMALGQTFQHLDLTTSQIHIDGGNRRN